MEFRNSKNCYRLIAILIQSVVTNVFGCYEISVATKHIYTGKIKIKNYKINQQRLGLIGPTFVPVWRADSYKFVGPNLPNNK